MGLNDAALVTALVAMLATAALGWPVGRALGVRAGHLLAVGPAVSFAALATQLRAVSDGAVLTWSEPWIDEIGVDLAFRLDGLAMVFGLLTTGVGALVLLWSASYLEPGERAGRFYGLLTLFAAAMLGIVLADDVVVLYVAWELTTVTSFLLIAHDGGGTWRPARRALLVTAAGGLCLLGAVTVLAGEAGETAVAAVLEPRSAGAVVTVGALLLVAAAAAKSAQFPVHTWLPGAMAAPTPVSAYLHAAAMVKAGIYLLLRSTPLLEQIGAASTTVIIVGLATAVVGAAGAFVATDLKDILARSTISHLGLLVAAAGLGTEKAVVAVVVHTIAHATFKAALFMVAGAVSHETGTRHLHDLHRVAHAMPVTTAVAVVAGLSMAGIPPLLGFVSKEEILGAFAAEPGAVGVVLAAIATTASTLTVAYTGRFLLDGFFRRSTGDEAATGHRAPWLTVAPPAALATATLALGVAVPMLGPLVGSAAAASLGTSDVPEPGLGLWHGVTPALVLSVTAIVVGSMLVVVRDRFERLAHRWSWSWNAVLDRIATGFVSVGRLPATVLTWRSATGQIAMVLAATLALGLLTHRPSTPLGDRIIEPAPEEWAISALLAAACLGAAAVMTRFAAVAVLGVVGFLVSIFYVTLGAPDVVLTQLLVEIVTVSLVVFVLRRLPRRFPRPPKMRRAGTVVVASAAGIGAGIATYLFTGRRPRSELATAYLRKAPEASGDNVVNAVLADFRALDTLGEMTVLAVAAVGVTVLLRERR